MKRIDKTGAVWLLLTGLTVSLPAHAYLDPSTGSMILSAIIGLFATMALAIKTYWYKFKNLFRNTPQDQQPEDRQAPADRETPAD